MDSDIFSRTLSSQLMEVSQTFPITVLTGPRQSGKTTLLKALFPEKPYVTLESPDTLMLAYEDPRGFLARSNPHGMIIDEAQKLPQLFSFIQEWVDLHKKPGQFILSGSQNFLLGDHVAQSLAGRCAVLELLPLSYDEFPSDQKPKDIWNYLYRGSYPRPYHEGLDVRLWLQSYLRTYVEKDVRDILNVKNLAVFQRFLKLCAGRHGQLLNLSNLALDAGISQSTAQEWLSILESSYLLYRLQPHHENYNKRLIKTPKLYFYDSGLVCHLLDIDSPEHLSIHGMRGAIFEGWVISECKKFFTHRARVPQVYFWRDQQGDEVDCLIERAGKKYALEVKATQTPQEHLTKGIKRWQRISQEFNSAVIYAGDTRETILSEVSLTSIPLVPWRELDEYLASALHNPVGVS